ncbi:hypothetical protein Pmani_032434 [Petrolisthes manimaculis]|uniref:Uncharacterized protein n=1 Tax=Petrolisthes manimaculis TaxID=1843537 RepID=A0AAE1TTT1_9EUCA|nr:hypothetical protein Pmani_032434 [Petrolisthes manimaculis]
MKEEEEEEEASSVIKEEEEASSVIEEEEEEEEETASSSESSYYDSSYYDSSYYDSLYYDSSYYESSPTCTEISIQRATVNPSVTAGKESSVNGTSKSFNKTAKGQPWRRPLWIGSVVFVTCLLICSIILQPISIVEPPLQGVGSNMNFTSISNSSTNISDSSNQGLSIDMSVGSLRNITWGLGFQILEKKEQFAYVWLYHDMFDVKYVEDIEYSPNVSLWITCLKDEPQVPQYFEEPWNGTWNYLLTNYLTILVTDNTIQVENSENLLSEFVDCSRTEREMDLTMRMECWSLNHMCPLLIRDPKSGVNLYDLQTVVTVGSLVANGSLLGIMMAWFWLKYININLYLIFMYFLPPYLRVDIRTRRLGVGRGER